MIVSAPEHVPVTTHLFVAGSQYLESDTVFGMKESLVAQFQRYPPGVGPDGERMDTPFYTVNYDFRLKPEAGGDAAASASDRVRT
jgi:hydroxyquinol 1,2-dioxygenase